MKDKGIDGMQIENEAGKLNSAAARLQERLLSMLTNSAPKFLEQCEFRLVKTTAELKACAQLAYREYLGRNYTAPNRGQVRLSIHHMLQSTSVFIALYKKKYILGTFSLVEDSPIGLPMDKVYKTELDGLRSNGGRLVEISMLALNEQILGQPSVPNTSRLMILFHLLRAGFIYLNSGMDKKMVVITIHPRHELFYRALKFKKMGELKSYVSVENNPALAFCLDLKNAGEGVSKKVKDFFGFDQSGAAGGEVTEKNRYNTSAFFDMLLSSSLSGETVD